MTKILKRELEPHRRTDEIQIISDRPAYEFKEPNEMLYLIHTCVGDYSNELFNIRVLSGDSVFLDGQFIETTNIMVCSSWFPINLRIVTREVHNC